MRKLKIKKKAESSEDQEDSNSENGEDEVVAYFTKKFKRSGATKQVGGKGKGGLSLRCLSVESGGTLHLNAKWKLMTRMMKPLMKMIQSERSHYTEEAIPQGDQQLHKKKGSHKNYMSWITESDDEEGCSSDCAFVAKIEVDNGSTASEEDEAVEEELDLQEELELATEEIHKRGYRIKQLKGELKQAKGELGNQRWER